jgi:hypothetical protein
MTGSWRSFSRQRLRLGPMLPTGKSGRWLTLAACPLGGGRVAVVIQPATIDQLLPAIAAWHDFTPRQHEVLHLLLQGHLVKQIARRLGLSRAVHAASSDA